MRPFADWLSAQIGTIEDLSIIDRHPTNELTPLQVRMAIADLLVPYQQSERSAADWLAAFSVDLNDQPIGKRSVMEANLKQLIGTKNVTAYATAHGDELTAQWLRELKRAIKTDTLDRS
jgi:hypothetical protein